MCLDKDDILFEFSEEYFAYLIEEGKIFDSEDIKMLIECCEIERIYKDYPSVISICEVYNKYYSVYWDMEDNDDCWYNNQPMEVIPVEEERTITFTKWYCGGYVVCETMNDE